MRRPCLYPDQSQWCTCHGLDEVVGPLTAERDRYGDALRRIYDVTCNEPDAVEAATRASHIAYAALENPDA